MKSGLWYLVWKSLSRVQLCDPMDCNLSGSSVRGILQATILEWVAVQEIFPTQGLNPGLPHCRRILYHLSHQGSLRTLERVTYPFSSRSSWPRIKLWSPVLQVDSLLTELPGKPFCVISWTEDNFSIGRSSYSGDSGIPPTSPVLNWSCRALGHGQAEKIAKNGALYKLLDKILWF